MSTTGDDMIAYQWARRRAAGERVDAIAASAGCAPVTVYRATQPYGPFLQPQQAARYFGTDERADDWIRRRRDGQSVATIAAADGIPERQVREATRAYGPYPKAHPRRRVAADDAVRRWVSARRAGQTLAAIAAADGASTWTVSRATSPFGPFERTGDGPGLLGISAVATLLGVTASTAVRWHASGFLAAPAGCSVRGHDLWNPDDVLAWADRVGLPTCEVCGARPKDLKRHVRMLHERVDRPGPG